MLLCLTGLCVYNIWLSTIIASQIHKNSIIKYHNLIHLIVSFKHSYSYRSFSCMTSNIHRFRIQTFYLCSLQSLTSPGRVIDNSITMHNGGKENINIVFTTVCYEFRVRHAPPAYISTVWTRSLSKFVCDIHEWSGNLC